jgi:hypothetical protein
MNKYEVNLLNALEQGVYAFDHADAVPDIQPATPQSNKLKIAAVKGNPNFTAQFDVRILLRYFTFASGTYTAINESGLHASLRNQLPVFVFGNSDFAAGFRKTKGQFPLTNWTYNPPFIAGRDVARTNFGNLDANALGVLTDGDLVLPFTAVVGGTNYVAFAIVRCDNVGYATLLDAVASDVFWINNIRYIISDSAQLGQFDNSIQVLTLSLFGKFQSDSISPNAFKQPDQFQNGIIDVPVQKGIDKSVVMAMYVNTAATSLQWSIFVRAYNKLSA